MTLHIPPDLRVRREYLQDKQSHAIARLIRAYISSDPTRIVKAKLSLARILKELSESPELGPKHPFKWGQLETVYRGQFDEVISWAACESTNSDPWQVATLLERSIVYV